MNYAAAREIAGPDGAPTGKWHWTVMHDGHVRPDGYCSPWEACPACGGRVGLFGGGPDGAERGCARCAGRGIVRRAAPCPGHDRPEEAAEHYRQYLLDHVAYDGRMGHQQLRCRVCGAWTAGLAKAADGYRAWVLCDDHRNRDEVDRLLEAPEQEWFS